MTVHLKSADHRLLDSVVWDICKMMKGVRAVPLPVKVTKKGREHRRLLLITEGCEKIAEWNAPLGVKIEVSCC